MWPVLFLYGVHARCWINRNYKNYSIYVKNAGGELYKNVHDLISETGTNG